ncbi:hypothetical protein GpartN1_g7281.t1 [Galdieria partita]|uniref:Embryonic stem cell-specific 5-hydroxymethylcytosine-binding protein n=1 Tax=Galdieria partita TaxID=83374 RepID=A0A9C7UUF8_9RHOD|nr:hypothetical protein GpartN1_g7281.t1 [Galdieria partita]
MCGRFVFAFSKDELENISGTKRWLNAEKYHTSYNVAPSAYVPIVRTFTPEQQVKEQVEELKVKEEPQEQDEKVANKPFDAKRVLHVMKWGLQPFWSRSVSNTAKTCVNARSETLLEKNMFRVPLKAGGRGVLIVNGFYEWKKDAEEKRKNPYFISVENGPLYMAVVYDLSKEKSSKEGQFTIITVDASPCVAWLHDRMPALLEPNQLDVWLDTKKFSLEEALTLLRPLEGNLKVQQASRRVNSVRNDGAELISYKRTREETDRSTSQSSIENFFSSSSRNKCTKGNDMKE